LPVPSTHRQRRRVQDGGDFWNLEGEVLEDYPVVVTAEDNLAADVQFLLHGADVMAGEDGIFVGIPDGAAWGNAGVVELNVTDGAATATLRALGLVAAFEEQAAEGEGEGEEPHGCFAGTLEPPTTPPSGDGLVMLLAVALLLPVLRLRLKTTQSANASLASGRGVEQTAPAFPICPRCPTSPNRNSCLPCPPKKTGLFVCARSSAISE